MMKRMHMAGVRVIPDSLLVKRSKSEKYQTARSWMYHYFTKIGDRMPHIDQVHLPNFLSRKSVYEERAIGGD